MFAFTVYRSVQQARSAGKIPLPRSVERIVWGQAVVAVGYDDDLVIRNIDDDPTVAAQSSSATHGANDAGTAGAGGCPTGTWRNGWPTDWWSLLKGEWADPSKFGK